MSTHEHAEQGPIPPENLWETVQLPSGKEISRTVAEEVKEMRYECPDPGHSGGYPEPGECRICRQPMVQGQMMVRWAEKGA
jgi:hypothetical protein